MTVDDFLRLAHDSPIGVTVREINWLFPAFESLHFVALCSLFGAILFIDLRVLGLARGIPVGAVLKLIPIAIGALIINLLTGVGFFCANPGNYANNPAFAVKMILVLVGAANALWFEFGERRSLLALPDGAAAPLRTKAVAILSLMTWLSVLTLGRLLPYVAPGTN